MRTKVFQLWVLFVLLLVACSETSDTTEIEVITTDEMQNLMDLEEIQIVDVRTPEEHALGFIENSQNIDVSSPTFDEDIAKLDKSKPVVVYCKAGGRSAKCADKLKGAGFVKIYDLDGGITQWQFKGLEVKTYN